MAEMSEAQARWSTGAMATVSIGAALIIVLFVSPGGSPDTPCGALVNRSFPWKEGNACGVGYTGALAAVTVLVIVGVGLGLITWLAPMRTGVATWLLGSAASASLGAYGVLRWAASWYPEPVLQRGWTASRNLFQMLVILLGVMTLVAATVRASSSARR